MVDPSWRGRLEIVEHAQPRRAILTAEHVCMHYGRQVGLADASVTLYAGELVAIVGGNGQGKSTLMRILALDREPTAGRITVFDQDVTNLKGRSLDDVKSVYLHYIPQGHLGLMPLTARETVAYFLERLDGLPRSARASMAEAALQAVGLTQEQYRDRRVDRGFSGGERARVAMATAIARNRPIVMADEILAAADEASTLGLIGLFRQLAGLGVAVAVIVHRRELWQYFDRVLTVDDKRLVEDWRNLNPVIPLPVPWPEARAGPRPAKRRWPLVLAALLAIALVGAVLARFRSPTSGASLPPLDAIPTGAVQASVVDIVDDKTIRAAIPGQPGNATVRLLGIVEPTPPSGVVANCYRTKAADGTRLLFPPGRAIYIEREAADRDVTGALLRDVWILSPADGKPSLSNEQLIKDGYAVARHDQVSDKYGKWLDQAQRDAQRQGVGLSKECPTSTAAGGKAVPSATGTPTQVSAPTAPPGESVPATVVPTSTASQFEQPTITVESQPAAPTAAVRAVEQPMITAESQPAVPTAAVRAPESPTGPPIVPGGPPAGAADSSEIAFDAAAWMDGYHRGDARWCGRPWTAVYGAQSRYPRATLNIALDGPPVGDATLLLTGMVDELPSRNHIRITVNEQPIFDGPSLFPNWDGVGACEHPTWTTITLMIPKGVLHDGDNQISVANLEPGDGVGRPPYVMLGDGVLRLAG